jgi:glycosyltransferase involved in cell wall biosynthesis
MTLPTSFIPVAVPPADREEFFPWHETCALRDSMSLSPPTRILFVTEAPFISGAEKSLQITVSSLQRFGIDVIVATPRYSPMASWCKESGIRWLPCDLLPTNRYGTLSVKLNSRQLVRIVEKYDIQLIHANQIWVNPITAAAAYKAGIPSVCHLRDCFTRKTIEWYLRPMPTGIICISNYLRACFLSHTAAQNVLSVTLYNPVRIPSHETIYERDVYRRDLCRTLNVSPGDRLFLFAGQFTPQKGIATLVSAITMVKKHPIHVCIVGIRNGMHSTSDYRTYKLLRELLSVGKVTFLPQQTDMSWLYRGFDVVIVPSLEEPLGRIPLEAASYGVPAIVSDIDGLSETVIPGITGWRVRPGDPFALAHAIIEACEYPLDRIRQAVCEYAHYHYSGPYYTVKLMRFYAYVLETHKKHGA